MPAENLVNKQFPFTGTWMPDQDPALIGLENFSVLKNLRYTDTSKEGVRGYSKINTTALATYPIIYNGVQLRSDRDQETYVLVHAEDSSGNSAVLLNKTSIPDQGDFEGTAVDTLSASAGMTRFSTAPGGNIVACNGLESNIWGGDEMRCPGFFLCDDANLTNPRDYTDAVNNSLSTTGNTVTVTTGKMFWLVLATRPLKGVKVTVSSANASASTTTAKYWDGSSFAAVSGFSDGTSASSKSLAQSGTMSFNSTVSVAKPYHFSGLYLYAYLFELSDGSGTISQVTVDSPWQGMVDIWDGVYRQCIQFQASRSSVYEDYTLEVNEESSIQYPIAATCGGLTASDHVVIMFGERMSAIRFTQLGGKTNSTAVTLTVKYWDGDSWEAVTGQSDGTSVSSKTLNQSGLVSWDPPASSAEFPTTLFGKSGYAYRLEFSGTLTAGTSNDGTSIDFISGVPAPSPPGGFKFASEYKGRVMLCNFVTGHEGNRVDYSLTNAADVFNGEDSSKGGEFSLYFGEPGQPILCGTQLYNRFGSNVFSTWVCMKDTETYLLNGDGPEDFQIYQISRNVGCPAPLTLATAETGFEEVGEELVRNVAIWCAYSGPVLFDGAVLKPLKGVDNYFNPDDDDCINYDAITKARGWYDTTYKEYNLLIPSGTATEVNTWLVYDLVRKVWFEKDPTTNEYPRCGFPVVDENGTRHIYGGHPDGYMMRLENGNSWDGISISQVARTGHGWIAGDVWMETLIRRLKVLAKQIEEDHELVVTHIQNTEWSGVTVSLRDANGGTFEDPDGAGIEWGGSVYTTLELAASTAAGVVKQDQETNYKGWAHGFQFETKTSSTPRAFQPIGWAIQYRPVRTDR